MNEENKDKYTFSGKNVKVVICRQHYGSTLQTFVIVVEQ